MKNIGMTILINNYSQENQMHIDINIIEKQEQKILLSSLTLEVDNIFFSLRKADQIIRRELKLMNQQTLKPFKRSLINPINKEKLIKVVDKVSLQQLFVDEYIIYMLKNENNSIFKLIEEYNDCLNIRLNEQSNELLLKGIDEKLVYYIRHLGAMTYHLNIHLNLVNVLIRNTSDLDNHTVGMD